MQINYCRAFLLSVDLMPIYLFFLFEREKKRSTLSWKWQLVKLKIHPHPGLSKGCKCNTTRKYMYAQELSMMQSRCVKGEDPKANLQTQSIG